MSSLSFGIAFFGGLVSFFSPCVLPLLPGFIAYLAGTTINEANPRRIDVFLNALFFVLGFSLVFCLLGFLLNSILAVSTAEVMNWLSRIGGAVIIFFGLYLTGIFRWSWLEREYRLVLTKRVGFDYVNSFVFGAVFAAGWTPCIGPILGSILVLAANQPQWAVHLLLAYSLGLGLPFLLIGLFLSPAVKFINRSAQFFVYARIFFGVVLVVVGILVFRI
jgi:cytochrome c-type biogenesis protein